MHRMRPNYSEYPPLYREHLSELQKKLVLRKIASEAGNLPASANSHLPPPPPPASSPPLLSPSNEVPTPPKKPPRELHHAPPSCEPRAPSPEDDSLFLEALKAKKGTLKRAQTMQVLSPPPSSAAPVRPTDPPRPVSGTQEQNDSTFTFQVSILATEGMLLV